MYEVKINYGFWDKVRLRASDAWYLQKKKFGKRKGVFAVIGVRGLINLMYGDLGSIFLNFLVVLNKIDKQVEPNGIFKVSRNIYQFS